MRKQQKMNKKNEKKKKTIECFHTQSQSPDDKSTWRQEHAHHTVIMKKKIMIKATRSFD